MNELEKLAQVQRYVNYGMSLDTAYELVKAASKTFKPGDTSQSFGPTPPVQSFRPAGASNAKTAVDPSKPVGDPGSHKPHKSVGGSRSHKPESAPRSYNLAGAPLPVERSNMSRLRNLAGAPTAHDPADAPRTHEPTGSHKPFTPESAPRSYNLAGAPVRDRDLKMLDMMRNLPLKTKLLAGAGLATAAGGAGIMEHTRRKHEKNKYPA